MSSQDGASKYANFSRRMLPRLIFPRKALAPTNPRGIPQAPFVDNVEDYVSNHEQVEITLRNFQEMIS
jgi:hypothetical protein